MFVQTTTTPSLRVAAGAHADAIRPRCALASIVGFPFDVRDERRRASRGEAHRAARAATLASSTACIGVAPRLSLRVLDREDWLRVRRRRLATACSTSRGR